MDQTETDRREIGAVRTLWVPSAVRRLVAAAAVALAHFWLPARLSD